MSAVAAPIALPQRRLVSILSPDRFDLLGADGSVLPAGSTDYAAFVDHLTGTVFGRTLAERLDQADAAEACDKLELLGFTDWRVPTRAELAPLIADAAEACDKLELLGFTDWRVPTRAELAPLIADGASEPATYAAIAPDTDDEWSYWTSSPVPGVEDYYFVVHFDGGDVYSSHRDNHRWVRPVRSLALPSGQ